MYRDIKILRSPQWRNQLLFITMLCMLVSLFLSRTALSISMIVFVIASLAHKNILHQLKTFLRSPLLWGMSLLFFLPLLSGAWSEDQAHWLKISVIKAPLFFMPLAFAAPFSFSSRQWRSIGVLFIALVTAGSAWSLFNYLGDHVAINQGYLQGKSMLTWLENDRVRFSWLITLAICLCFLLILDKQIRKPVKIIFIVTGSWLIVFLHLLSVRTGLFSFYILVIALAIWLILRQQKWVAVLLVLLICLLPLIAYFTVPSFKNRVNYFLYELPYFKNTAYLPGGNDAIRVISMKAGWEIMNALPLMGTGLGDLDTETLKWYGSHYPAMRESDKIAPGSQWLIYGAVAGWPGFLVFTFVMLLPFLISQRKNFSWVVLNIIVAFSFLFDIGLEVQFGVFIYSFVVLSWWKWLEEKNANKLKSV